VNRRDLEKHLRMHGCLLFRHGSKHDIWIDSALSQSVAVPRHAEIKKNTVRAICRTLSISRPQGM
jgi:predicted RNA binding protein YcfA (HicA-like mRNA interferase family)